MNNQNIFIKNGRWIRNVNHMVMVEYKSGNGGKCILSLNNKNFDIYNNPEELYEKIKKNTNWVKVKDWPVLINLSAVHKIDSTDGDLRFSNFKSTEFSSDKLFGCSIKINKFINDLEAGEDTFRDHEITDEMLAQVDTDIIPSDIKKKYKDKFYGRREYYDACNEIIKRETQPECTGMSIEINSNNIDALLGMPKNIPMSSDIKKQLCKEITNDTNIELKCEFVMPVVKFVKKLIENGETVKLAFTTTFDKVKLIDSNVGLKINIGGESIELLTKEEVNNVELVKNSIKEVNTNVPGFVVKFIA